MPLPCIATGRTSRPGTSCKPCPWPHPENDAVWYYLALTASGEESWTRPPEALKKAIALDSTNYWYRRLLGRLYLLQNRTEEGMALYEAW